MAVTDLENTTVSSDSIPSLCPLAHNSSGTSVTPSATMRCTTFSGIDSALVGVKVKVTMMVSFRICDFRKQKTKEKRVEKE
jgi:hypothetical protein